MKEIRRALIGPIAAILLGWASWWCGNAAYAAFQIHEQSTSDAAVAAAGTAAVGRDAATSYYNPAAMTLLDRNQAIAGFAIVVPDARFSGSALDATGNPVVGTTGIRNNAMPLLYGYGVWAPRPDLRFGFSVNEPFGQGITYDDNWIGRYFATKSQLVTINIGLTAAWRALPWLSIGGGIDIQHAHVDQRAALDFGSICFGVLGPGACAAGGLFPQGADGGLRLTGDSWAVGYNFGVLAMLSERTRVGVTYRSRMVHRLDGPAEFTVPANALPLTAGGQFQNTSFATRLELPDTVTVGIAHQAMPYLLLLGGFTWTRWSVLQRLDVSFANPAQPSTSQQLDWNDGYRVAAGVEFRPQAQTVLRGGVAYEWSPVPDRTRSVQIPSSDRLVLALGASHRLGWAEVSGSYTLNLDRDGTIQQSSAQAGALQGTFSRTIHVIGLQMNVRF